MWWEMGIWIIHSSPLMPLFWIVKGETTQYVRPVRQLIYSPTCPPAYCDRSADAWTRRESIELEVVAGVVVADVLNHAREALHVVWQQALLNVVAEQIAEQTAEILMTRI